MSRLIIKIGTNLLTKEDNTQNTVFMEKIVREIAELSRKGHEIVLVTSGAVACGRSIIQFEKEKKDIPVKQVLAAVGQGVLMHEYCRLFAKHQLKVAQVLLTNLDFSHRKNFLNTRNIVSRLLNLRVIPIVNENDVTAYDEIQFGDNDNLSARLSAMIDADMLILLTDVDGLYTEDPATSPHAKILSKVPKITEAIKKMAGKKINKKSCGGMVSKIAAAEYATQSGVDTLMVSGREENVLCRLMIQKESLGTFFPATCAKGENKKRWMKPQIVKDAWIEIDAGAVSAMVSKGASLLPKGVVSVQGDFKRGDIVNVKGHDGEIVAYGLVNYSAKDTNRIKGQHSKEIARLLDGQFEPEIMQRDNVVMGYGVCLKVI
ncbi:glutamate 5-kinase [Candidatus Peregrinibacteria bacterium]|nr:glutamate 5-kinase [Candidatus Peregrinibacteria bacterium]